MKITYEDDRVIIDEQGSDEETAHGIILDVVYKGESDLTDEFLDKFDIDPKEYLVNEDFYQGMNLMRVIERKSDRRLFGYQYWQGGGKYGEAFIEANGEEHGLEEVYDDEWNTLEGPYYVFSPVEPVTFTGYVFEESDE